MKRIKNDFYPTPTFYTKKLLERVSIQGTVLEPCNGEGAISALFPNCVTNDIDSTKEANFHLDASDYNSWEVFGRPDWVVTNPPFNQAHKILPLSLAHCTEGCAFFLRLSYIEPTSSRREWLEEYRTHLQKLITVNPRPRFRSDTNNTDSVTCAWFVFHKYPVWMPEHCPFDFI